MTHPINIKRAYVPAVDQDGFRVLVDRIWPRGVTKASLKIDLWLKEIAPSTPLRKWFNHDPAKWDEFQHRYRAELRSAVNELNELKKRVSVGSVTLVYGAKDEAHNQAVVLRDLLRERVIR